MVRDPQRVSGKRWQGVQVVKGDVRDRADCERALQGIDVAYYLVHSMALGEKMFSEVDREAATLFSEVAKSQGVKRIIYLGGIGASSDKLSHHLKSRQETGDCLRSSGISVTEFRAGVIIGSGSLSFEMLRYLTERLPFMICPRWVRTIAQPIAIRDVLRYLIDCLDIPESESQIFEIGGKDRLSYGEMMQIYAQKRGLRRFIINVPVLTPRLSSYWVNLVTPIPASIARPLIDGVKNEAIAHNTRALELFKFSPLSYEDALVMALQRVNSDDVETRWATALSSLGPHRTQNVVLNSIEGLLVEERTKRSPVDAQRIFDVVVRLGGESGWPRGHWLWEIRGWIDRLFGGVGLRRGRRSSQDLQVGDAVDFWRVEAIEQPKLLRLRAEMKVPGLAWLEFVIEPSSEGSILLQRAIFEPKGVFGLLYWWSLYPFHAFIFQGMVNEIVRRAETATPRSR